MLVLATALCAAGAPAMSGPHPNIVFIPVDDMGYADLGCYGPRDIRTPRIDRLSAKA